MFFSTTETEKGIIDVLNYQRALDLLYDADRASIGLSSPATNPDASVCVLKTYLSEQLSLEGQLNSNFTINNFAIECSVESWKYPISKLSGFKRHDVVQTDAFPWATRPRENNIISNYKISLKKAKEIVSFSERCKQRAYDIAFATFLKYTQQKVSVYNMKETLNVFSQWITSTENGQKAFNDALKLSEKLLEK